MASDGAGTLTYTPAAGFVGDETFSYTATDPRGIDTCILYGDFNGTWLANATNTTVTSGIQSTTTVTMNNGNNSYLWNVWCNDTVGNSAFNITHNYTVYVDSIEPSIDLNAPVDGFNTTSYNALSR